MPMGFLDDDPSKIGSRLTGIKILGPIKNINTYIDEFQAEEIIIAINDFPIKKIREINELIDKKKC